MIEFQNVSIIFPINTFKKFSLRGSVIKSISKTLSIGGKMSTSRINLQESNEVDSITALDNIDFKIENGQKVGVYGNNGSGKSTLLKTVAGIYPPVKGQLNVTGKINNLLNIGFGFNPELSGRENVKFRLIVSKYDGDTNQKIFEIQEFSGLGDFFDLPIKIYSSGMVFRLGFSIISQINADIVLMDEWLSAGDEEFLNKVNKKLNEIVERTQILMLASHSKDLIKRNCNTLLILKSGKIQYFGKMLDDF
jgi:lipopolysaccharide transport system ATP-binding protein